MDAERAEQWAHERAVNTYEAMKAYERLMGAIVTEHSYWLLRLRENPENIRANSDIIERAAARGRELDRELEQDPRDP